MKKSLEIRFWEKIEFEPMSGCWLWTGATHKFGYGILFSKRGSPPLLAHRLAWELSNGTIPSGMCVCHKCDNPFCVNPGHMFIGTKGDNCRDMVAKGRDVGNRRLTAEQVSAIRAEYAAGGVSQSTIAKKHGTTQSNISFIVLNRRRSRS